MDLAGAGLTGNGGGGGSRWSSIRDTTNYELLGHADAGPREAATAGIVAFGGNSERFRLYGYKTT